MGEVYEEEGDVSWDQKQLDRDLRRYPNAKWDLTPTVQASTIHTIRNGQHRVIRAEWKVRLATRKIKLREFGFREEVTLPYYGETVASVELDDPSMHGERTEDYVTRVAGPKPPLPAKYRR